MNPGYPIYLKQHCGKNPFLENIVLYLTTTQQEMLNNFP